MQDILSDKDLAQGILNGDDQSLRYLYNTTYGKIESFVINNSGNTDEAKDIFQEGVIALYQNIESGRYQMQQTTQLTSYLFQICKFKWYSVLRSAYKKKIVHSLDHQNPGTYDRGFEDDMDDWEINRQVREAIDKLGERCRELLIAYYYDEKSMKDIAESLGQQTNSVKNAKYRCMQSLKDLFKLRTS